MLFKDSKQYLGLGDYHVLRHRGIERYLCLVLIAHLLLTHLGAFAQGAQAEPKNTKPLDLPSVPQLQTVLGNKLWDDNINSMATARPMINARRKRNMDWMIPIVFRSRSCEMRNPTEIHQDEQTVARRVLSRWRQNA